MSCVEQTNVKRGRGRPRRLSGSVMCGDDLLLSLLESGEGLEKEGVRGTQSPEIKEEVEEVVSEVVAPKRKGKGKGVRLSAEEKEEKKAALKKEKEEKKAALKKEKEAEKLLKKEAMKKEKEEKKEAMKKEKEEKKAAMKKEKEDKKEALKKEKEEKKEALKKEKAAEKAAKKAANKAAKKAENKSAKKEGEGVRGTQSPEDELQSEKYIDEDGGSGASPREVRMFEHEGVQWLKDDNNVLYSPETHKEVARWNPEEQAVMV